MRRIRCFFLIIFPAILIAACGDDAILLDTATPTVILDTEIPHTQVDLITPPSLSETPTPAETDTPTATPTFRPTAILATPETLDREFSTSDRLQSAHERLVNSYIAPNIEDERVLAAMRAVQRHSFVPAEYLDDAYGDHPLPIGYGQTISQPSLVAWMTELLELEAGDRVLEIGTGSGYQAAILAELTGEVYSVEIIPELADIARAVLDRLGYVTVRVDRRDGYFGWPEYAP